MGAASYYGKNSPYREYIMKVSYYVVGVMKDDVN